MDSNMKVEPVEFRSPLWQRLGWMVMIYVGSVAVLGVFAMLIRLFMQAAGMKSH
ncbi:DUF2474 domain-containing protein [Pseudomonas chlororaphis]|uniref:Cyanide insensitive terminal oxidase, putative subunit III n=1 Tax=Pseudomonas chlororaphis TaxID=587753 RepID=A0AAX3FRF9_9PSED|nr:DUF2474 domain-containing protein [Pseudomonas chlororaphis]AZC38251.1 hypothetical protein C4K37_3866 [Pseudomonas chlororaphis subsp. piscium]AZC44800.1 hypothetical protein C4K36_3877 [Pseudomonas chlororaphis subsp. piscium]WDG70405.1 DUF2474 domain-containing protein [Pseudomonas chlororaphis]WDG77585.1 DUF2474 domain-containing protein [Pseudomonas chlororaphis]WDG83177.1 DUF2474 domain-containing protein [Pseudomonas chlororaphis]